MRSAFLAASTSASAPCRLMRRLAARQTSISETMRVAARSGFSSGQRRTPQTGAVQNARMERGVEIRIGAVQQAAVVPHQDIAKPPLMPVHEPLLGRMFFEASQQRPPVRHRATIDMRSVFAQKEALAAG